MSKLQIVRLYHDLLGTYGDQGNAEILIHRAKARGFEVELHEVAPAESVPDSADIYLLGGGEDGPQSIALEMLLADGGLNRAVSKGATLLAVCAGFQLIGTALPNGAGQDVAGLGIVDATTIYTDQERCVGELVIAGEEDADGNQSIFTGFENHQGRTRLGEGVTPLGVVLRGFGNGIANDSGQIYEGVKMGNVYGTYMHGPVLARNPSLADQILTSALGTLATYDDEFAQALALERRSTLWPNT